MASGRSNRLVGQAGEFAVCAQLAKFGLIATPFAGNVPEFDLIVVDEGLRIVPVQVKTNFGNDTWQVGDVDRWVDLSYDPESGQQHVRGWRRVSHPNLIMDYVWLAKETGQTDRFFILRKTEVQQLIHFGYSAYLAKHSGVRPRKADSRHCAISIRDLSKHEDNWNVVQQSLACASTPDAIWLGPEQIPMAIAFPGVG